MHEVLQHEASARSDDLRFARDGRFSHYESTQRLWRDHKCFEVGTIDARCFGPTPRYEIGAIELYESALIGYPCW